MSILITFLASIVFCCILVYTKNWHLRFSGDYDLSGPQKFHKKTTPRIGGLAIFISFQFGLGSLAYSNYSIAQQCFYLSLASLPVFVAGLAEDFTKTVGVKWRLISSFCSGFFFIWLFEIMAIRFDLIYLDTLFQNPSIVIVFLSFAIAGLANAYNIIDGFNGLASMVGIISLAAISYVGLQINDELVIMLALITISAIGGFFLWNYPRGFIFLGDSGAYWIGFLIACLSILLVVRNDMVSPWFALMVNAYPIFETLFTIWRRSVYQRKSLGLPDGVHFHTLIYRRVLRWEHIVNDKPLYYLRNAKTSPYLWLLSSIGVIPAVIWWDSTVALMTAAVGFLLIYLYLYRMIVRFQTPRWFNPPQKINKSDSNTLV
jgi:UDP-GlcNAc:undecaprenyl-phosphate GlcNAc-1-phosphate transferase